MRKGVCNNNKPRESNFELLRIIAMFMILILHADFKTFGFPTNEDLMQSPTLAYVRVFYEMACVVAVNVFVLISGWFGITPSLKGFAKFAFQCLFFSIAIYVASVLCGQTTFSTKGVVECFAIKADDYWFIPAYICLYIFAPVLNVFLRTAGKHIIASILLAFFIFQCLYSFVGNGAMFLMNGYSTLSFMGLYMLSYWIKNYVDVSKYSKSLFLLGYLILTILLTVTYLYLIDINLNATARRIVVYSNPIVILSSVLLLLYFSRIHIKSALINNIAVSCFSVYLFHSNPNLIYRYTESVGGINMGSKILDSIVVLGVISIWFVIPILMDKLRILIYNMLMAFKRSLCKASYD